GAANLHGWGFTAAPDPVLLYVRGFDPGALQYRYAVNGRFGATAGANGGVIVPFQVALQVHMTVGPDRTRDRLRAAFGGRRGAGGGGRGGLSGVAGGDAQGVAATHDQRDAPHVADVGEGIGVEHHQVGHRAGGERPRTVQS